MSDTTGYMNASGNLEVVFPAWTIEGGLGMKAKALTCTEFRRLVEKHFGFLLSHGFQRVPKYEKSLPLLCTVIYMGRHLAFEIYFDVRDKYVGLNVVKVINGVHKTLPQKGFSEDLGLYLQKRGLYKKMTPVSSTSPVERSLMAWAELLRERGRSLLMASS